MHFESISPRLAHRRKDEIGESADMIGKPVALIQVPNQRLFGMKAAARYLGIHEQTLRKLADERAVPARRMGVHRVFLLDDLDQFIQRLPAWYPSPGDENPRRSEEDTCQ